MKKYLTIMLITIFLAASFGCNKDSNSDDPPSDKNYTVEYKFNINENYNSFKLNYYEPSLVKKEVEKPTTPWQKSFTNFKQGDSVFFHLEIVPLKNTTLVYSWEVNITGEGYSNSNGATDTTVFAGTVVNKSDGWAVKIE
ncbi:MAG: hypothetical protein JEY97_04290 [Bacteroidales bacterium]|nr:hypothetical protein [Bacteroidales bacterium]